MSKENSKKGDSAGESLTRTDIQLAIDTGLLRALEEASDTENARVGATVDDPYNRTSPPFDLSAKPRRRLLDDMRRLSEAIKASRRSK